MILEIPTRDTQLHEKDDSGNVKCNLMPYSTANNIRFEDGETLQEKFNNGLLGGGCIINTPFLIKKIYDSVDNMNTDFYGTDVNIGEYVLISCDNEDNGKIFIKGELEYNFVISLSLESKSEIKVGSSFDTATNKKIFFKLD